MAPLINYKEKETGVGESNSNNRKANQTLQSVIHTDPSPLCSRYTYAIYKRKKAQKDQLFKKYNNYKLIGTDSDDKDEEDDMLRGFMTTYLASEMDPFQDSIASMRQVALERKYPSYQLVFCLKMDELD